MGWQRISTMDLKVHFISDYLKSSEDFSELCKLYTISRKTGYKWIKRYKEQGVNGLEDRSRRPLSAPQTIPFIVKNELIELRKKYQWGPKKLLTIMAQRHTEWEMPARSTAHNILKRAGLINQQKRKKRIHPFTQPLRHATEPNVVWTADFKGQFRLKNNRYCYPLTISDAASRFLVMCHGVTSPSHKDTKNLFIRAFKEYGLPQYIRTDNGAPFVTRTIAGLSKLALWWIHLGIYPERITPGKPQENGRHERMHRTLKKEATIPPEKNMTAQQKRFDIFRYQYNQERPHEALDMKTPAACYTPSPRAFPDTLPDIEYPAHYYTKRVHSNGCIMWKNKYIYIGYLLNHKEVGLNQVNEEIFELYYSFLRLGHFNEKELDYSSMNQLIINP